MGRITKRSDENKVWFWLNELFYKNIDEHNAVITIHSETYWCTWRYTDLRELLDLSPTLRDGLNWSNRVLVDSSVHTLFLWLIPLFLHSGGRFGQGQRPCAFKTKWSHFLTYTCPSVSPHIVVSSHSSSTSPETEHRWVGRAQMLQQWLCECVVVAVHLPWRPGSPSSQAQSSWQTRWTGCCLCWSEVPAYFGAGTYTVPGIHTCSLIDVQSSLVSVTVSPLQALFKTSLKKNAYGLWVLTKQKKQM